MPRVVAARVEDERVGFDLRADFVAKFRHEARGHGDERPAHLGGERDGDRSGGERRDHEEGGKELAALAGIDAHGAAA